MQILVGLFSFKEEKENQKSKKTSANIQGEEAPTQPMASRRLFAKVGGRTVGEMVERLRRRRPDRPFPSAAKAKGI